MPLAASSSCSAYAMQRGQDAVKAAWFRDCEAVMGAVLMWCAQRVVRGLGTLDSSFTYSEKFQ